MAGLRGADFSYIQQMLFERGNKTGNVQAEQLSGIIEISHNPRSLRVFWRRVNEAGQGRWFRNSDRLSVSRKRHTRRLDLGRPNFSGREDYRRHNFVPAEGASLRA
jgi:hypothetical protein